MANPFEQMREDLEKQVKEAERARKRLDKKLEKLKAVAEI